MPIVADSDSMKRFSYKVGSTAPAPLLIRSEEEVMSTWLIHGNPVVSICCATYNHIKFLEDALCGFMGQITSFPFEVIIRDDASTDGTTDIVRDYATRYPNIIRTIIEKENQYVNGARSTLVMLPYARGEFIALCEGDDYWISPTKLEKQLGLLRTNVQCTMSVAQTAECKYQNGILTCSNLFLGNEKLLQNFDEIITNYFHTSTYLIRTNIFRTVIEKYIHNIEFGDTALRFMLVHYGPFVLLPEVVSIYRVTGKGVWTGLDTYKQMTWEIKGAERLYRFFEPEYKKYHGGRLYWLYRYVIEQDIKHLRIGPICANFPRFIYFSIRYWMPTTAVQYFSRILNFLLRGFNKIKSQTVKILTNLLRFFQ